MDALAKLQRLGLRIVLSSATNIKITGLSQLSKLQKQKAVEIATIHKEVLIAFLKVECLRKMGSFPSFKQCLYLTATDCPNYPMDCLSCSNYRGATVCFCKKIHWWKPWPMPDTGELPQVTCWRGHVWHTYRDGTTRFIGYLENKATACSYQATKQHFDEGKNDQ